MTYGPPLGLGVGGRGLGGGLTGALGGLGLLTGALGRAGRGGGAGGSGGVNGAAGGDSLAKTGFEVLVAAEVAVVLIVLGLVLLRLSAVRKARAREGALPSIVAMAPLLAGASHPTPAPK